MAIRTRHELTENTWFITFTCFKWIPLFEITQSYDLVYQWLKLIDDKYQIKTLGFVIMPNHVHLLLYLPNDKVNLNTISVPAGSLDRGPCVLRQKYYIYLMAIRTKHELTENTWFITFTCFKWIPLFEITQSYDLLYQWLKLIDDKYQIKTLGFVIMPNHVHLLLHLTDDKVNLNTIIGNAKRFMAYDFIKRLQQQQNHSILNTLASACTEKEKAKGQLHKAFEPSFDAKPVYTYDFLHQKLDYIHHNPLSGKWNLCNEFTDYAHSCAAFYHLETPHPFVTIADYRYYWY